MDIVSVILSFKDYVFNFKFFSNFVKYKIVGEVVDVGYVFVIGIVNIFEGNY